MEGIDRIERAKRQYETLLLNLGSGAFDDISYDNVGHSSSGGGVINYENIGIGKKILCQST